MVDAITHAKAAATQSQIAIAIALKTRSAQQQHAAALLALIESAAAMAGPALEPGRGEQIDVTA